MYARARGGAGWSARSTCSSASSALYGKDFSKALYRCGVARELLLDHLTMQVEAHPSGYVR